jgi:hypothetical protein
MRTILLYSVLLLIGLLFSQFLPVLFATEHDRIAVAIRVLTMTGLAFIMIHVGFEFHIDKTKLNKYGWDYLVAFTAASFPWVLVTGYFIFCHAPTGGMDRLCGVERNAACQALCRTNLRRSAF